MNQTVVCKLSGKKFEITDRDFAFYTKIGVPPPTLCPEERRRRRFAFRNERFLYKRKSSLSGKEIISCVHPDDPWPVYSSEEWFSDSWDAIQFGRPYDFSKTFFEQYLELQKSVPAIAVNGLNNQNCPYANYAASCKNCHLIFGSVYCEDCLYGNPYYCKSCIDSLLIRDSELCYECVTCEKCYECFYCQDCAGSFGLLFCYDCHGSKNCIGSVGLRNKEYYIFNKPYSKEEYFQKKREMRFDSWEARERLYKEFEKFLISIPHRCMNLVNCEDCTGDHLLNSKNSHECYEHRNLHSCKWMTAGDGAKDCYECYSTGGPELCYQSITPDNSYNCAFTVYCWKSQNVWYSENCHSSRDLFGCIGMKRRSFCILNKQYIKEEYTALRGRIVDHMKETREFGEFFSFQLTPFAYNESVAHETQPLEKNSALALGYAWQDILPGTLGKQTVDWRNVPDSIENIDPQICKEIFPCTACGKNFKILESEFSFYKKQNIPLPRKCVNCRHFARKKKINPLKLWPRTCMKCQAPIQTTYAPERPEMVYCEKCYLESVY